MSINLDEYTPMAQAPRSHDPVRYYMGASIDHDMVAVKR